MCYKTQIMKEFKITFWREPYNSDSSFVKDINSYLTSATITKFSDKIFERFHVKLTDIGLHSLYGEFDIICKNGQWQTIDHDSIELNFLKWNIIFELSNHLQE